MHPSVNIAELQYALGARFFDQCWKEAFEIKRMSDPIVTSPNHVPVDMVLAVAIGKIANRIGCPRCGLVDNVHCVSIKENKDG